MPTTRRPGVLGGPRMRALVVRVPMDPPAALSPNARLHWRAKQAWKVAYRDAAWAEAMAALAWRPEIARPPEGDEPIPYRVVVGWGKGRRMMDDDNAAASCKAARDGIAAALCMDDRRLVMGGPVEQRRDADGVGYTIVRLWDEIEEGGR